MAKLFINPLPSGMIAPYAGNTIPNGWLTCEGQAVSRTAFAALFSAIGTLHGTGDGSTTFNVPDFRGRFLRGHANGSANDPDRAGRGSINGGSSGDNVGSIQAGGIESHGHSASFTHGRTNITESTGTSLWQAVGALNQTKTVSVAASGGNETRPINTYVKYIIKI